MSQAQDITDTGEFPAYTDKYELMEDIRHAQYESDRLHIINRLGNTDVSTIAINEAMTVAQFDAAYVA